MNPDRMMMGGNTGMMGGPPKQLTTGAIHGTNNGNKMMP
jgi:hypothetical protein